jgi:hypothetical protein
MESFGIVYLIQPAELVGTSRFKVGCLAKNTIDRVANGYRKGSRCIYIIECKNPFSIEKILKTAFTTNFKLIAGKEYFEGDEIAIKKLFIDIVFDDKIIDVVLDTTTDNKSSDASHTEDDEEMIVESETDESELDEEVERIIKVTTYADYIKYSRVTDIIITNKKYDHGYIKVDGNLYYPFVDGSDPKEYVTEAFIINKKLYTRLELRKIIPYVVEYNNDKTKYYTINRDYEYIGYDSITSLSDIEPLHELFKREYLFNDGNKPWESTTFFNDYVRKYLQLTKNMTHEYKKHANILNFDNDSSMIYVDSKNEDIESLQGWLQNNCKDSGGVSINNKWHDLSYDWNKIIADTQKTRYNKEPNLCIPDYNEYILNNRENTCVLLEASTFKTSNINNKIVLNSLKHITLHYKDPIHTIDTSIIDKLINAYVTDKTHILNFKKLCKSVFIEPSKIAIVFNEPVMSDSLSRLLYWVLYLLGMSYNKTYSSENDDTLISHVKLNGIPRLVFTTTKNIEQYIKRGIINIVQYNKGYNSDKLYSIDNYNKWCITNKDIIDTYCSKQPIDYNIDELLNKQSNLFWHFFKWCCVD